MKGEEGMNLLGMRRGFEIDAGLEEADVGVRRGSRFGVTKKKKCSVKLKFAAQRTLQDPGHKIPRMSLSIYAYADAFCAEFEVHGILFLSVFTMAK